MKHRLSVSPVHTPGLWGSHTAGAVWVCCFPSCTHPVCLCHRTLTQEDPGDNQITLEEVVQMVNTPLLPACPRGLGWWQGSSQRSWCPCTPSTVRGQWVSRLRAKGAAAKQERLSGEGPAVSTAGSVTGRGNSSQPTGTVLPLQSAEWLERTQGHLPVPAGGTWESPRGSQRVLCVPRAAPFPGDGLWLSQHQCCSLGMCHGFRAPRVAAEHLLPFCIKKKTKSTNPTKPVPRRTREPLETGLEHLKHPRFCPLALLVVSGGASPLCLTCCP